MRSIHVLVTTLALVAGCGKLSAPPEPASDPAPTASAGGSPVEEARTTFKTVCAACHGEAGRGDGPAAATLTPKPRNYTDHAWQAAVTDDQIRQTILMGGAAVGKSPAMPAQPQLKDKPEVVAAMVQMIREFGK